MPRITNRIAFQRVKIIAGAASAFDPVPDFLLRYKMDSSDLADQAGAMDAYIVSGTASPDCLGIKFNEDGVGVDSLDKVADIPIVEQVGTSPMTVGFKLRARNFTNNTRVFQLGNQNTFKGCTLVFRGGVGDIGKLRWNMSGNNHTMPSNLIEAGEWQQVFVTLTAPNGLVKFWVDGVEESVPLISDYDLSNIDTLIFDIAANAGASPGDFLIDDFRIYNRELTAQEKVDIQNYTDLFTEYDVISSIYQAYILQGPITDKDFSSTISKWYNIDPTPATGAYPLTQAIGTQQPVWNRLVSAGFAGVDDYMSADRSQISANGTIVTVMSVNNIDVSDTVRYWEIGTDGVAGGCHAMGHSNGSYAYLFNDGRKEFNLAPIAGDAIITTIYEAGDTYNDVRLRVNGVEIAAGTVVNPTAVPSDNGGTLKVGGGFNSSLAFRPFEGDMFTATFASEYSEKIVEYLEGSVAWRDFGKVLNPLDVSHKFSGTKAPPKKSFFFNTLTNSGNTLEEGGNELVSI